MRERKELGEMGRKEGTRFHLSRLPVLVTSCVATNRTEIGRLRDKRLIGKRTKTMMSSDVVMRHVLPPVRYV